METILDSPSIHSSSHSGFAGFWIRFVALLIDGLIIGIPIWLLMFAVIGSAGMSNPTDAMGTYMALQLVGLLFGWLYSALMESSKSQATIGKQALGLKVTDVNGDRISFVRATGRHFSKLISSLIFLIGYLMVAFTEKKQGLHDIMAGTLVVKKWT